MTRARLPLSLLALVAACQDSTLTATRERPEVAIVEPARGSTLLEGAVVRFVATLSDPDGREEEILTSWRIEGDEPCSGHATADGASTCDVQVPAGGVTGFDVVLTATDGDRLTGQDTAHYDVVPNAAPTVVLQAPRSGDPAYSDRPVELRGHVDDAETVAEALTVLWSSDLDGDLLGGAAAPDSDGGTGGFTTLSEGDHTITLSVEDEAGKVARDQVLLHVGPPNSAPTCVIFEPAEGEPGLVGAPTTLRGQVQDPDTSPTTLTVTWSSDLDGPLGQTAPSSTGDVLDVYTLSRGAHTLTLTATDDVGASCTDVVRHVVGSPPEVVLDAPTDGARFRTGDAVTFTAHVTDEESAPDDVALAWSTDLAGALGTTPADPTGLATFVRNDLPAGAHTLTLVATDPDGLATTVTRGFVVNRPPPAPTVRIVPASADTTDALVATFVSGSIDPDGQAVSYAFAWLKDGVPEPARTGSSIPAAATTKHETWTVRVTPNDGLHDGDVAEASATIANSPPALSSVDLTPSSGVRSGTRLGCAATATDDDGDALSSRFSWSDGRGTLLATGVTWVVEGVVPGTVVTCVGTVDDGDGGTATGGASVTVLNSPPVVTDVALNPSTLVTPRTTLTCDAAVSDADHETLTVAKVWTDGAGTRLGSGPVLVLTDATAPPGTAITCTVTATDASGASSSDADTVVVEDPRPQIADVTIVVQGGGPPGQSSTLQCVPSGFVDPQGDPDRSRFLWTVDGFTAGSTSTLAGRFTRGQRVRCIVIPSDGTFDGAPKFDEVLIVDTPPSIASVTVSPTRPTATSTLVCSYLGFLDPDGDADASTYAWTVDGVALGSTARTLSGAFGPGDHVTCTVTPRSPDGTPGTPQSATVTVDTPPGAPVVIVTPRLAGTFNDLTCSLLAASDPEGDPLTYEVQWLVNGAGTPYAAAGVPDTATVTVPNAATGGAEVWTCEARAFDGLAYGPWAEASVDITCPAGSGQGDGCPGASCADILLTGTAHGDAAYWLDPTDSGVPYEVWCDMDDDGGGWTLVLQAEELSAFTYDHRAWRDPSFASPVLWDVTADLDAVSPAFYELVGTQTRLCLPRADDGSWTCDLVDHAAATPTALATGPVLTTTVATRGLLTDAMKAVFPGEAVYSLGWQRWGWNHGTEVCGGVRLGWTGDGDGTDSRDAGVGVGINIRTSSINCNPKEYALMNTGSGYYHFPWSGVPPAHPNPTAKALPSQVWFR